ncbi:3'-5' exoribonuclease domain-containing protein [Mycolicibacterium senegalense]|uniref:3'-5' exoribonuclease domain-containing protein n=1 Tax=Mycolicibacterium senegalense TaxID=1796 RepID=UPI003AB0DF31
MTVFCYDTEFLEDGRTIELISIGIVCEDGREYYAVNADCDFERVRRRDWLWANVVPHLPTTKTDWQQDPDAGRHDTILDTSAACVKPKATIAQEVRDFLLHNIAPSGSRGGRPTYAREDLPQLWAYFGAYDHVVLAQLFGTMADYPALIPMWTHDLMQLIEPLDDFRKPAQTGAVHNALADARWNYELLQVANAVIAERRSAQAGL